MIKQHVYLLRAYDIGRRVIYMYIHFLLQSSLLFDVLK